MEWGDGSMVTPWGLRSPWDWGTLPLHTSQGLRQSPPDGPLQHLPLSLPAPGDPLHISAPPPSTTQSFITSPGFYKSPEEQLTSGCFCINSAKIPEVSKP